MVPENPEKKRRKASRRRRADPFSVAQGEVLARWRRRHKEKLSQKQLAERAGLSVGVLGDLERGTRSIRGRELIVICRALGAPIEAVLEAITAAQMEALRKLDEGIGRERGESWPAAEAAPAAEAPAFGWNAGKQGLFFWGVAGDRLSVMRAMNRFMVQNEPLREGDEDSEEPPAR